MSSATRVIIDPKRVIGHVFPPFDFLPQMAVGDSLTGPTVTVTVWSGVDANPGAVWDATTVTAGSIISPGLQGGLAGVIYLVRVTCTAGSKTLVLEGLLAVLPEGM
jgi:hypothetical protein